MAEELGCSSLWIVFSGSLVQDRRRIHHSSFPLSPPSERRADADGGRILPIPSLGPVSAAVAAHLPRPSEGALPGKAARCTSVAVYLMLIPAAAAAESALLLLLDRKGTESSNRFGRVAAGCGAGGELSGDDR